MAFKKVGEPEVGSFFGWSSSKPGQVVEGIVIDYDETGGVDFQKNSCPLLTVKLTRKAVSVNKENERTQYDPGDELNVTCGLSNLKKYIKKVDREEGIERGNGIRIELTGFEKVPDGKVKLFEIQIDKDTKDSGDSGSSRSSKRADDDEGGDQDDDDEPPF